MTRRGLREHCFKMLFCAELYPAEEAEEQLSYYFLALPVEEEDGDGNETIVHDVAMEEKDRKWLKDRVGKILQLVPSIDEMSDQVAEGWKVKRMGKAELTLLRLAVYEMRYDDSVPVSVAINEAVELGKRFGGDDSGSFINGILGKIAAMDEKEEMPDTVVLDDMPDAGQARA